MTAPTDNLVRALACGVELRAPMALVDPDDIGDSPDDEDDPGDGWGTRGRVLTGRFAVWNEWTRIDSMWEGTFLERVSPGAFDLTLVERAKHIKALYDHGADPQLGNKPLGPWRSWRSESGQHFEVDLLRTSYNDDFIIPAAAAGQLGASFRFRVVREQWVEPRQATAWNPDRLPERTIEQAELYEFGPVSFPAYLSSQTGMRSRTDDWVERLLADPAALARFIERVGPRIAEQILAAKPADGGRRRTTPDAADGSAEGIDARLLRFRAVLATHRAPGGPR